MSDLIIRRLESRITTLNTTLEGSIESKVATLTAQINELTTVAETIETSLTQTVADLTEQINTLNTSIENTKSAAHYVFQHTGEAEGDLTTPNMLVPLAYGSGAANQINFALYVPFKCEMDRVAMISVFGENERSDPGLQVRIEVVHDGEILITEIYPQSTTQNQIYHHGITNQESVLNIQNAGSFIYVYTHASNLLDDTARHRMTFYFKKYYLENL